MNNKMDGGGKGICGSNQLLVGDSGTLNSYSSSWPKVFISFKFVNFGKLHSWPCLSRQMWAKPEFLVPSIV